MKACPDCGEPMYSLGCTNCNEEAYIREQEELTSLNYPDDDGGREEIAPGDHRYYRQPGQGGPG